MRKNRILSIFLCIAVVFSMFSGIFTNTPTAKADGTSGRGTVGKWSGGDFVTAHCIGFGLKFSLKKRSRVLALHSPRNKKVLLNTMYDDDISSAFLCVSFKADGTVAWGKENSKFRMAYAEVGKKPEDSDLKYDKGFANLTENEFIGVFDFSAEDAFKSVIHRSMNPGANRPKSLDASGLANVIDKNFSNQSDATATAKKRLYSQEGREKFYTAFVNELSKANANALEDDIGDMDDWVKDGVLVIEPYAIYNDMHQSGYAAGITYLTACQVMGNDSMKNQFQMVFGGFSISGQAGGLTAVRSLGGFYNGHGRKDCNYHPAGTNGQNIIHASDCTDKGAKWERIYSPELRDSYSYKLGWGAFGIWKGGEVGNKSAANLSIKVSYGSNGNLNVDKQSSMVSASEGFKGVSANINSMNSSVQQNTGGKYHGRQKLGDNNKKAHVLNLPSGQKKYYGDYKLTSYGSYYVKANEQTFKYSSFKSKVDSDIPSSATANWSNVSGSDYNCGRRVSGYSLGSIGDNPKNTAIVFANWFGLSRDSVTAITGNRLNIGDATGAKQAKIAYNAFALANNYGTCESIKYNSNGITKGITGELKDDSKSRFGFSVQYLYKGKEITSYISTAKLKYDENLNPTLTIGSHSSKSYDIGGTGKFTTNNTRAYIIAVPNCNSNNGYLLKNNANGSSIWGKVKDKASSSKKVIQLSDVASIITSNTGEQASIQGSANGSRTISVGTDSDDGYSIYVLEIDLPKSVPISSVLNLQDYQINYVYPKSLMTESASLGEKVNSNTVVDEITASNEHVSKESSTWTCGGGITHSSYQDDYAIKLFHGSGTSGHTVSKSFSTNALLMYNTSLGAYNTFSSVNRGWNTTSNNNALRIDYAFNLTRGGLNDKRTISGLSEDSYKNEKGYAIDSLGMEYGNKPKTVEAGGTTIRDSWAKYCNRIGDKIKFKSEWVNGGESPVEAYCCLTN